MYGRCPVGITLFFFTTHYSLPFASMITTPLLILLLPAPHDTRNSSPFPRSFTMLSWRRGSTVEFWIRFLFWLGFPSF